MFHGKFFALEKCFRLCSRMNFSSSFLISTVIYGGVSEIFPVVWFLYIVLPVLGSRCDVSCNTVTLVSVAELPSFVALIRPNLFTFLICAVTTANTLVGSSVSFFCRDAILWRNSIRNSFLGSTAFFLISCSCLIASV